MHLLENICPWSKIEASPAGRVEQHRLWGRGPAHEYHQEPFKVEVLLLTVIQNRILKLHGYIMYQNN